MTLSLSVPAPGPLGKEAETSPKKAKQWVETLPLTKTVESAHQMIHAIEALNRVKLPAEERMVLIDIYRPTIATILEELEAIYSHSAIPLPAKPREAFNLSRQLLIECSYTYKILLLDKVDKRILFNAKKSLPPLIYRVFDCLHGLILQNYKTYQPAPPGVWQELHQLYEYAEMQALLNEMIENNAKSTLADIYHETAMIALADPYRLKPSDIERIIVLIKQNRGMIDIRAPKAEAELAKCFIVELDTDRPPRMLIHGHKIGQKLRVIDTHRLVERLGQAVKKGATNGVAEKRRASPEAEELMSCLIQLWGNPPQRQSSRTQMESGIALCCGIRAIAHFIEQSENEDTGAEIDIEAIRAGHTIPLLKIPQDPLSQQLGIEKSLLVNQSANGLRVQRDPLGKLDIKIGEIVGVRFIGAASWHIGIVRWLTLLEETILEFGVELIANSATAMTIEPTLSAAKPQPALLLASEQVELPADELLTLPDTFNDLREFRLSDGDKNFKVRALTLVEKSSRFDLFQFKPS